MILWENDWRCEIINTTEIKTFDIKNYKTTEEYLLHRISELEQHNKDLESYITFELDHGKSVAEDYLYYLHSLLGNLRMMNVILEETIKNEDGEESHIVPFKSIKSLAAYIKATNDININFLKEKLGVDE